MKRLLPLLLLSTSFSYGDLISDRKDFFAANINNYFPINKHKLPVYSNFTSDGNLKLPCGIYALSTDSTVLYNPSLSKIKYTFLYSNNNVDVDLFVYPTGINDGQYLPSHLSNSNSVFITLEDGTTYKYISFRDTVILIHKRHGFFYEFVFNSKLSKSQVARLISTKPLLIERSKGDGVLGKSTYSPGDLMIEFHSKFPRLLEYKYTRLPNPLLQGSLVSFQQIPNLNISINKDVLSLYNYSSTNHLVFSNTKNTLKVIVTNIKPLSLEVKPSTASFYAKRSLEKLLVGNEVISPIQVIDVNGIQGHYASWVDKDSNYITCFSTSSGRYPVQYFIKTKSEFEMDSLYGLIHTHLSN